MTTDAPILSPRSSARRGGPLRALWAVICLFLALLALLAWRMADGADPALRARAAATSPPPRRILVRRVIERRVIVHLPPTAPPRANSSSQQLGAGASPFSTAVTRAS